MLQRQKTPSPPPIWRKVAKEVRHETSRVTQDQSSAAKARIASTERLALNERHIPTKRPASNEHPASTKRPTPNERPKLNTDLVSRESNTYLSADGILSRFPVLVETPSYVQDHRYELPSKQEASTTSRLDTDQNEGAWLGDTQHHTISRELEEGVLNVDSTCAETTGYHSYLVFGGKELVLAISERSLALELWHLNGRRMFSRDYCRI
ncbi:hypothetical protein P171DRAFT_437769, partial [Karstenula rhodostoma CBS 690.94]